MDGDRSSSLVVLTGSAAANDKGVVLSETWLAWLGSIRRWLSAVEVGTKASVVVIKFVDAFSSGVDEGFNDSDPLVSLLVEKGDDCLELRGLP